MNTQKYKALVLQLVANGEDFTREACQLSHSELTQFAEYAKAYGYKKPVLHSRGYGFYMLLKNVYNKLKTDADFINDVAERVRIKTVFKQ